MPPSSSQPAAAGRVEPDLLRTIARLSGDDPAPATIDAWVSRIDRSEATLEQFIDEALTQPRFSRQVVPSLLFGEWIEFQRFDVLNSERVLKHSEPDERGRSVLYLGDTACATDQAVSVRPWWDLSSEVLVCPGSYLPDRWARVDHEFGAGISCDGEFGRPPGCGCGPNLVRCQRDRAQFDAIHASFRDEVRRTTAHVVDGDLPLATLYTSQETFHDRNVEYFYRWQKVESQRLSDPAPLFRDLADWPETGRWGPRAAAHPGQHAGLVTAPVILLHRVDRRQRMYVLSELLFCTVRPPFGATTERVLEVGAENLQLDTAGWELLAKRELCTDCHARLDYGVRFFMGYPNGYTGMHYGDAAVPGEGPFYVRNIDDLRGRGPLTPHGWATLATQQPEFNDCVSNTLTQYVLGARATADDRQEIARALRETQRVRPAARAALLRYAAHWRTDAPAIAIERPPKSPAGNPPARETADAVAIHAELRAALDDRCGDCHDEVPFAEGAWGRPFDMRGDLLPRKLVVRALDQVAYGKMPKGVTMDPSERAALVSLVAAAAFPDPAERAEAESYYLGQMRALPAQMLDNATRSSGDSAVGTNGAWRALEPALRPEQHTLTPGFAAMVGLDALATCRGRHAHRTAGLRDCLREALRPDRLVRWLGTTGRP